MDKPSVVLDTNVLVAAMRSREGASFAVLELVAADRVQLHLSVPLVLEYEEVLSRENLGIPPLSVGSLLDDLCAIAELHDIHFLWRPFLSDPDDDFLVEVAFRAHAAIVTHNVQDFQGIERLGVEVLTPKQFLDRFRQ